MSTTQDPPWPRTPPRFVPTLTEVVTPGIASSGAPGVAAVSVPASPAAVPEPVDVDAVMRQLAPELDRRISEAIARVMQEQMLGVQARLERAVTDAVRESVRALAEEREGVPGIRRNP